MTRPREVAPPDHPLRVLYVVTKANWGGAQRYVYDIAVAAKAAGHEVLVVSGAPGPLTERLEKAGVHTKLIHSLKRDVRFSDEIDSFKELLRIVRVFAPDVLHANSSKAGGLGALAGRIAGVRRIVFTSHGWAYNEKRPLWQKVVIGIFHYATVLMAHRTICVSGGLLLDASWMPFVRKRFSVIHNGITPVPGKSREEARAVLAPDLVAEYPNAPWVGTVAELHPTKGLDILIEAFGHLAYEYPDAVLVIVGDGSEWPHLAKLIQIYDQPKRIVLAGFVPDAVATLPAFDLFVLPSRSEALGYVLLEAGTAELPVIATRVGGIPEVIEDGVTGRLVPKEDVGELTDAMLELLTDPGGRQRLGAALKDKVASEFSTESMVRKTLALYR